MIDQELSRAAAAFLDGARVRGLKLATAESCTGGLVAAAICAIAGASDVFERMVTRGSSCIRRLGDGDGSETKRFRRFLANDKVSPPRISRKRHSPYF